MLTNAMIRTLLFSAVLFWSIPMHAALEDFLQFAESCKDLKEHGATLQLLYEKFLADLSGLGLRHGLGHVKKRVVQQRPILGQSSENALISNYQNPA